MRSQILSLHQALRPALRWDYHPRYSHELGELGIRSGIFPLYEIIEGEVIYTYDARKERVPVLDYLMKQGRFVHIAEEDIQ